MDNLLWGLHMTALGMGLVFALLALLWGLLTLVLRFDKAPAPAAAVAQAGTEPVSSTQAAGPPTVAVAAPAQVQGMDPALVAAILVATLTHRAVRRREAAPEMRSYWPGSLLYASRWVGAGRAQQNRSWQRRIR
jgi:Na+-transporting methylmalonyl-CoA/oxaloacetate decarboxylase gamma subunit